jgi:hypothetical protein
MAKKVIVKLTELEAQCMRAAVGNSLYSDEDALALFAGNKHHVNAAYRAEEKLRKAIQELTNK